MNENNEKVTDYNSAPADETSNHQDDNEVIFEQIARIFIYFTFPNQQLVIRWRNAGSEQ